MSEKVLKRFPKKVNTVLRYVKRWLDVSKMSLNVHKNNYISFHSPGTKLPLGNAIKIGKKHNSKVKCVKFLGLLLDEHLSCNNHLCQLSKNYLIVLARASGILFKIRKYLITDTMKCIYNSLFMSCLQYSIIV